MSVGIDVICSSAASSCSASVSTLPNTMPSCFSDADSKIGPNMRHGGHQVAQKSTRTMSLSLTAAPIVSPVRMVVAIRLLSSLPWYSPYSANRRAAIPSLVVRADSPAAATAR